MICVTGSEGFIGKHVLASLPGTRVCVDRVLGNELTSLTPQDLRGVSTVIHCAAHADISRNWDGNAPAELYRDNIEATWALLRACSEVPTIRAFVFCSTAAVYGDTPSGVIRTEADPVSVLSPYAASKLAGEAFVSAYAHKHGWRWHIARLVSCIGSGYTHGHIADFVARAKLGPVTALDAGISKSALHVEDAANALLMLALGSVPDGIYNVTSIERWGWRDTARVMGLNVGLPNIVPSRGWVGDPIGLTVSGQKLAPWWQEERSVEDGCRQALKSLGWVAS